MYIHKSTREIVVAAAVIVFFATMISTMAFCLTLSWGYQQIPK
jgi:hypothetical protein